MRLLLKFKPMEDFEYYEINNYTLQGFVYSLLKNSNYSHYHNTWGFKYFCFSNIFPVSDFITDEIKNLIISSPNPRIIREIEKQLKKPKKYYIGKYPIEIDSVKVFKPRLKRSFITTTPIVLYKNNRKNIYYSIKKAHDFQFFLDRLKENALKKYNAFYDENYYFDGNIFDKFEFNREVAVRIKKGGKMFIIIGTLWKNLEKFNMENKKFYRFILDCGLGEKNSLGFGMLNTREVMKC
ncbi:CRISPR-associated protein Cas6 [Methanothermobacter sp. MT-2]|nr:CRISPR-associated protein Cas6 [Methanothermobacter sp. MT-2]